MATATYPVTTIAKLLLLTPRRVQQLTAEGVIPKAERGRYELVPAVQGYVKYLRDRAAGGDADADGKATDKGRLLKARADLASMEAARAAGTLVPVDLVDKAWAAITEQVMTRLSAVPSSLAPRIPSSLPPDKIEAMIREQIDQALQALASGRIVEVPLSDTGASGADRSEHETDGTVAPAAAPAVKRVGRRKPATEPGGKRRARKMADVAS